VRWEKGKTLEYWNNGMLEYWVRKKDWNNGMMEYWVKRKTWNVGIMECWNIGIKRKNGKKKKAGRVGQKKWLLFCVSFLKPIIPFFHHSSIPLVPC
jgi:hypothetical protein